MKKQKPEADDAFLDRFQALFNEGLTYPQIAKQLGLSRSKAAELGKTFFMVPGEHRNSLHNWRKKGQPL